MADPERAEVEHKELFNRADCVRYTLSTFSPYLSLLVGGGIETKYLPTDDVYIKPGEQMKKLHSLDRATARQLSQLGDPGIELTDERLKVLYDEKEQARRDFGLNVTTHASRLGLTETLTSEQVQTRLALLPDVNLAEQVDQEYSDFHSQGWDVLPNRDNKEPILLVPNKSNDGQISFEVVSLDELHNTDSEFLPQQIRDYEEKSAMHDLANIVIYNLSLHRVPEAKLMPEYIKEVAQITDPEQRLKTIESMRTFMTWMVKLGPDYYVNSGVYRDFIGRLSLINISVDDDRHACIQPYLEHISECPTTTEETRRRNTVMIKAYEALLSIKDIGLEDIGLLPVTPVALQVLQDPARYVYLNLAEKRYNERYKEAEAEQEHSQKVLAFIEKTRSITDRTQLLSALQQELPDFHATLVNFQKWLDTSLINLNIFDHLISRTADHIIYAYGDFSLQELNTALEKDLNNAAYGVSFGIRGEVQTFQGIAISRNIDEPASLYNPHLEALLPLLAIKYAQTEIHKEVILTDNSKKRVQRCQKLIEDLVQSYSKKAKNLNVFSPDTSQSIAKDKKIFASIKEQFGITDEEIADFVKLVTLTKEEANEFKRHTYLFTGLFNAMFLEKQGAIDMHSPAFKALLKSLYPDNPDRIWQDL